MITDGFYVSLTVLSSSCLLPLPPSDDDIIFEDFARQRLIGAKDEKEEDEEPVDSPKLDDR